MLGIGEVAAIATSAFWAISALFFTIAGRRVSSPVVNVTRLVIAMVLIAGIHFYLHGTIFPFHTEAWRWGWLSLSAVLGLVIGDAALFSAYVRIGPQLSMLVMTLTPVFSAIGAWWCFQEQIQPVEMAGIAVTIAAIGWVVTEKREIPEQDDAPATIPEAVNSRSNYILGIVLALVGSLGQTANLVFTKFALTDNYSTLSATEIRIFVSTICLVLWFAVAGRGPAMLTRLRDARSLMLITAGAIVGPILGIWASYVSIQYTRIGIASTIMATPPLLLIPLGAIFLNDRMTARSVMGTMFALVGVAILFLGNGVAAS